MRIPQSLADRGLLEDEPFRTAFAILCTTESRTLSCKGDPVWRKLVEDLYNPNIGLEAVQTWAEMAFTPKLPHQKSYNAGDPCIFAEFFWLLFQEQEGEAMNILNQERKNRNLGSYTEIKDNKPQIFSQDKHFKFTSKTNNRRRSRGAMKYWNKSKNNRGEVDIVGVISHSRRETQTREMSSLASSFDNPDSSKEGTQRVAGIQSKSNPSPLTTTDSSLSLSSYTSGNPDGGHIDGRPLIPARVAKSQHSITANQLEMQVEDTKFTHHQRVSVTQRDEHLEQHLKPLFVEERPGIRERQASRIAGYHYTNAGNTGLPRHFHTSSIGISLSRKTLIDPPPGNTVAEKPSMPWHRIGPHNKGPGAARKPWFTRGSSSSGLRNRWKKRTPKGLEGRPNKRHRFVDDTPIWSGAVAFPERQSDFNRGAQNTVHPPEIERQTHSQECTIISTPGDRQRDANIVPPFNRHHSRTGIIGSRKRKEQIDEPHASVVSAGNIQDRNVPRTFAKLPKATGVPLGSSRIPSAGTSTVSSNALNMHDIDQNLCHAGALGLATLNNPGEIGCHWEQSDDPQDETSYDDDDDDSNIHTCTGCLECEIGPARQPRLSLQSFPPIWAKSRQELCESFDWFRSYQGGVYHSGGIVKGYLLSAFASSRDKFHHGGKLIISHGGGKAESVRSRNGELVTQQAEDQLAQDKSVGALLTTHKNGRPLVLLIDDKYALFPYDLAAAGVTYAVLGFYYITHAWAEYQSAHNEQGRVVRYKFAFQWCQSQGDPWWTFGGSINGGSTMRSSLASSAAADVPRSMSDIRPRRIPHKIMTISSSEWPPKPASLHPGCRHCKTQSPHIYSQGWTCLNPGCVAFWTMETGLPPPSVLDYADSFLTLLPTPRLSDTTQDLRPPPPVTQSSKVITTSYRFCKGWHCVTCGRLSCRFKWEHWECSHCQATFKVDGVIRSSKDLNFRPKISFYHHSIAPKSGIMFSASRPYKFGNDVIGEFQTYILPWNRGRIHHIRSRGLGNHEADKIFREYQAHATDGDLAFRRWPLRTHKLRGPLLTNYFSQNAGEPYQYVGGTANTVPLDSKSATAVQNALKLIQGRINEALQMKLEFNEVLSAAYMERQKMAFHSDSEKGLGPTIAGLSLGSPALMHFRLNPQYVTKGQDRDIDITFLLCHGDVLVMEGPDVQIYYQHTVVPFNFRIAATARWIDPRLRSDATP